MVSLEVIDLLAKKQLPEVFAEEFNNIKRGCGPRFIAGEAKTSKILAVSS